MLFCLSVFTESFSFLFSHISEMEEEISDWNTTYRQIKSRRKELEK